MPLFNLKIKNNITIKKLNLFNKKLFSIIQGDISPKFLINDAVIFRKHNENLSYRFADDLIFLFYSIKIFSFLIKLIQNKYLKFQK